ncbi:hypothetical protein BH18ACT17_BH18ACT17_09410 [soil metagenome]
MGQTPGARTDLENVIGWTDCGIADELRRDQTTAKEVLALRPRTATP